MPKKPKASPQVGVKFEPDDLKKLDELVGEQKRGGGAVFTPGGRVWAPSRSSAIVSAVRLAWLQLKNGKSFDPRQVDLVEAIERSELAPGVDELERRSKALARKIAPKKKPRPAHRKKRRSATVKRSKKTSRRIRKGARK